MTTIERPTTQRQETLADKIRERHPDWPDLNLSFYFATHANGKDIENIYPHIEATDVLLYESVVDDRRTLGLRNHDIEVYNEISQDATVDADALLDMNNLVGTMYEHRVRGVAGTGKAVGTIDIGNSPREQYLSERLLAAMRYVGPGYENYDDALDQYLEKVGMFALLQDAREDMMVGNFEGEIDRILTSRPDLKAKPELNILISMGAAHTTLRHKFTDAGFVSDRAFNDGDMQVYSHGIELVRALQYDKQPTHDLVQRAFMNHILNTLYRKQDFAAQTATREWVAYERRVVGRLNDEQMGAIFSLWNQNEATVFDDIQQYLADEGLELIPSSEDEIIEANRQAVEKYPRNIGRAATR